MTTPAETLLDCAIADPGAELRRLASLGGTVRLQGVEALEPSVAVGLLDFFLRDQAAVPVEPFATVLEAMLQKRETSLWDVSPGSREARDAYFIALPRDQPECMSCGCFPLCQGFGAYAGGCLTCKAILTALAAAARELTRLRAEFAPSSRPGSAHVQSSDGP